MTASATPASAAERAYRKVTSSWAMYDWANSAFATTIMAAMFPPFYRAMVIAAGHSEADATAFWAYATSISLLVVSLLAPMLGAMSDHTGGKKVYTAVFAGLGVIATALFAVLGDDSYQAGSLLFLLADIGFAGSLVVYESLLPHIAREKDIDRVSTRGYALGYLGGGILLFINVLWFMKPQWFFMPNAGFALRAAFFSVAVWWALFSIPLLRYVPEPPVVRMRQEPGSVLRAAFPRLGRTFVQVTRYKQLLLFLVAFWLYDDGIGTIIKMATAYGDEIGIGLTDMTMAPIITQFVGIPCSFAFGSLAKWVGCKRSILMGLAV